MNYELAKRLKDAGFPQYSERITSAEDVCPQKAGSILDHRTFDYGIYPIPEPDDFSQGKAISSCILSREYLQSEEGRKYTVYFPTLEELIEACGEEQDICIYRPLSDDRKRWCAVWADKDTRISITRSYSTTPIEAVANLWLTLNEKSI